MTYEKFLQTKIEIAPVSGFDVSDDEINPVLKPHQRDGVAYCKAANSQRDVPTLFDLVGCG